LIAADAILPMRRAPVAACGIAAMRELDCKGFVKTRRLGCTRLRLRDYTRAAAGV